MLSRVEHGGGDDDNDDKGGRSTRRQGIEEGEKGDKVLLK
jgi:hypothetical protein